MYRTMLCVLLLSGMGTTGAVAQAPLDLIPADALAGVAIRNLDDLKKKGDRFIKEADLRLPLRPSDVFDEVYGFLGVRGAVDPDGSAAIVLASKKAVGVDLDFSTLDKYIVVALPFSDRDRIAGSLGLKKGALKPDTVVTTRTEKTFGTLCYARGKHLFLGNHEKALLSVARSKGLGGELTESQRKSFGTADLLVHLGTEAWGQTWKSFLRDAERVLGGKGEEPERRIAQELLTVLGSVRFGLGAIRIDGGLGINLVAVFPKEATAARKFLTTLRAGTGTSSLRGLPEGQVVAAQAAHGDGTRNEMVARVLFDFLLDRVLVANRVVSPADRPVFLGIFAEVWRNLRGSRFALYRTDNEQRLGLFSLVGILDTADADRFLNELKQLARFADPEGLDLKTPTGKEASEAEIERLIRSLGARRFASREAASTRLALIGEPILPYLEKAARSEDAEVARRARELRAEVLQAAAARRRELLGKDLTRGIKPSFVFLGKGEEIEGQRVTLVEVRLKKKDAAAVPQLRQLLGPEWNRLRLAVHGKQVALLIGSDVRLLRQALGNLKKGRPGLASSAALREFEQRSDAARKMEFHASVQAATALARAADLARPGKIRPGESLSSFALTVAPDRLQLDFWLPSAEFKVIARANGF